VEQGFITSVPLFPAIASSFLIGALYPLTQIYQHDEDRKDGVLTISALLGKKGSFLLSMLFFICAAVFLFIWFQKKNELNFFYLFLLVTVPVVSFFFIWMRKVWLNENSADFKHSLRMNIIATFCTATYFLMLIIINH
jgi:1,4-dihydroxy-2-naphthoate octaprenyltransferase